MQNPPDQFRDFLASWAQIDSGRRSTNGSTGNPIAPEKAKENKNRQLVPLIFIFIASLVLANTFSSLAVAQSEATDYGSKETEESKSSVLRLPVVQFDPREFIRPFANTPENAAPILRFQPTNVIKTRSRASALSFTRDGSRLIVGGNTSSLEVWNPTTTKLLRTLKLPSAVLLGMTDEGRLVTATQDGEIFVYDMKTLQQVSKFETEIAFRSLSTFGNSVLTGSEDGVIHVWDLKRDTPAAKSKTIQEPILWLSRTPNGSRIYAGTKTGRLGIWESLDEFPEIRKVSPSQVRSMEFSPNGDSLAIASRNNPVGIRNLKTWRSTWQLELADDWQRGPLAFSPDSAYFVSTRVRQATDDAGKDESNSEIEIYDTQTRRIVGRLLGQTSPVEAIKISPLGDYVATVDAMGDIRLWRSPFRMIDEHRLRLGRETVTALIEKSSDGGAVRTRLLQQRAFLNARLQQWQSAAEDFLEAKNREPDDTMHWMRAGVMLLLAGDMAKYREHTQEMLKRFEHPPNAYVAERTAKLCVLPTEPIGDKETVTRLARFATENSEDSPWSMYFPMTEALVKYRYGEYDAALRLIDVSRARTHPRQVRPDVAKMLDHVIEALCWAAVGDRQRSNAALENADEYLQPFVERPIRVDDSTQHGWFIARMLYDEAKLLNQQQ